jgi:glycolate oxidase iron-sulfur subunit
MNKKETAENRRTDWNKKLAYDETFSCVQCGYCLPVCPTYQTMGKETHSPRGRINLVKMTAEGKLTNLDLLADSIDKCLGCRACETACPTGVKYGKIYESAKSLLHLRKEKSSAPKGWKNFLLRSVIPNKKRMNRIANVIWFYQRSGLRKIAKHSGFLRLLPYHLGEFEALLPTLPSPVERAKRSVRFPAQGKPKYRVAFFTGCVMDAIFEKINRLSIQLLQKAGCEVVIIEGETCCGALHAHTGDLETAKQLAKQNITAFEKASNREPLDFIVNNAGGCGAMLLEYDHFFRGDPEWEPRARTFAAKTKDISQVLSMTGPLPIVEKTSQKKEVVTYQRSCHMTHVQKVTNEPLQLIRSIPGIELCEMEDPDKCCGSAGIYNMINYKESMEILNVKMSTVKNTDATTVITTNPGCLLQMKMGILREGLQDKVRAIHLVDLLAEACGIEQ